MAARRALIVAGSGASGARGAAVSVGSRPGFQRVLLVTGLLLFGVLAAIAGSYHPMLGYGAARLRMTHNPDETPDSAQVPVATAGRLVLEEAVPVTRAGRGHTAPHVKAAGLPSVGKALAHMPDGALPQLSAAERVLADAPETLLVAPGDQASAPPTVSEQTWRQLYARLTDPARDAKDTAGDTWPESLLEPPRGYLDVRRRQAYHRNCINTSVHHPDWAGVSIEQQLVYRNALRMHAFDLHATLSELWGAFVEPNHEFYGGPWIETVFWATFARPVYQRMTLKEYLQTHAASASSYSLPPDSPATAAQRAAIAELQTADPLTGQLTPWALCTGCDAQLLQLEVVAEEPYDFELFYPWVPLFIPWERILNSGESGGAPPLGILELLRRLSRGLLRRDVTYVTVVQRPTGLPRYKEVPEWDSFAVQMLVIGSGGLGNIAIPLLAKELPLHGLSGPDTRSLVEYPRLFAFLGHIHDQVIHTRRAMRDALYSSPYFSSSKLARYPPHDRSWEDDMRNAAFQLAPRGVGPTSFRLYEALQMGLVPIYIFGAPGGGGSEQDMWLPYWDYRRGFADATAGDAGSIWHDIGYVVHSDRLPLWLSMTFPHIVNNTARYATMKAAVAAARDQYFTYDAVMRHLYRWLHDPLSSELYCAL